MEIVKERGEGGIFNHHPSLCLYFVVVSWMEAFLIAFFFLNGNLH